MADNDDATNIPTENGIQEITGSESAPKTLEECAADALVDPGPAGAPMSGDQENRTGFFTKVYEVRKNPPSF